LNPLETMETLTSSFEGVKKSLREETAKIREIQHKLATFYGTLEGTDVDKIDIQLWGKELQDVITELGLAQEGIQQRKMNIRKIEEARSAMMDAQWRGKGNSDAELSTEGILPPRKRGTD
jgi:hypothetical protein